MAKRRQLKRIPALPPEKLEKAIAALDVTRLSKQGRLQLGLMLRAAANPDAERIDVIISTLDNVRKRNVMATTRQLATLTRTRVQRGSTRLRLMPDDEFNRLVEEANRD